MKGGSTRSCTIRPLSCELGCLHRADGSSLWKSGSTHVLAAVYGPIAPRLPLQARGDRTICSVMIKSTPTTSTSTSTTFTTAVKKEWEELLTFVLSASINGGACSRTVIEVVLQVIQDDGSVLAASLHAAVAALMDAGVAMSKKLPVATTCLVENAACSGFMALDGSNILLDPTAQDERGTCRATLYVLVTETHEPSRLLATHSVAVGHPMEAMTVKTAMTLSDMLACVRAAENTSQAVYTFWKRAIEQRATRESKTLWSSA